MLKRLAAPEYGTFVPPTVLRVKGIEALAEEVFGPVLHVATFGADEIDAVVDAVNGSGYGLTFGLHTRIDDRVQHIVDRVRVGNIYVNRNQIGAVVGSQPFGGEGLSGTGPKAGGPHYVRRLMARRRACRKAPPPAQWLTRRCSVLPLPMPCAASRHGRVVAARAPTPGGAVASPSCRWSFPAPPENPTDCRFAPRGAVLCLGPGAEAVQAQVAMARAAGNAIVAVAAGANAALTAHGRRSPRDRSGREDRAVRARYGGRHRRRRLLCGSGCSQGDACRACPTLRPDPAVDCGSKTRPSATCWSATSASIPRRRAATRRCLLRREVRPYLGVGPWGRTGGLK